MATSLQIDIIIVVAKFQFVLMSMQNKGKHDDSLLYFIETRCEGIPRPPYFDGAEIACAMCTK